MTTRKSLSLILSAALLVCGSSVTAQQTGMYHDHRNDYLIPLQQSNALVGHAYVKVLDRVSRDSASYVVGVFDQYLTNVGERKINLPTSFTFDCAAFDGKDLYTRFMDEGRALRYIVFNQQAQTVFDTTLKVACKKAPKNSVVYFQQASIFSVGEGAGVIDNVALQGTGSGRSATIRVGSGKQAWIAADVAPQGSSNRVLHADKNVVVEAVYRYASNGTAPRVKETRIITLDAATGHITGGVALTGAEAQNIYPVNASVEGGNISVISQFTRQGKRFSRVKYGVCIHNLDITGGSIRRSVFNEFTKTLLKDTALKGRQLMSNSYLHVTHAAPLAGGHWLVSMQQFSKRPERVRLIKNKTVQAELKSLVFAELDESAQVIARHTEATKPNRVTLPRAFFTAPQAAGTYLYTTGIADVYYFNTPTAGNSQVSFIYADVDENRKLTVGNILYKNGAFTADRATGGALEGQYFAGLVPARFGHTYLITFSPFEGFNFENIKFNN